MKKETATPAEVTDTANTGTPRERKLVRSITGTVVTFTEQTTGKTVTYDFATLPTDIQAKLGPYGLNQKLGDSGAGKSGQEALDAIQKCFEALAKGDWSFRAPAAPKITVDSVKEKLANMSEAEQEMAKKLLAGLGLNLG